MSNVDEIPDINGASIYAIIDAYLDKHTDSKVEAEDWFVDYDTVTINGEGFNITIDVESADPEVSVDTYKTFD